MMYCCGTRKSHPRTRIISSETRQSLVSDELFWSLGGISLSHNNTYEGYSRLCLTPKTESERQGTRLVNIWICSLVPGVSLCTKSGRLMVTDRKQNGCLLYKAYGALTKSVIATDRGPAKCRYSADISPNSYRFRKYSSGYLP